MAHARMIEGAWAPLAAGLPIEHEGIIASYETVMSWSDEDREVFGVFAVGEGDPAPEGKRIVSSAVGDRDGRPVWVNEVEDVPPAPVPETVTMRQARLALLGAGLLPRAREMIEAMPGDQGEAARIEWEYATELRRDHPLVAQLGQQLGLDDAAKDDLFRQAAAIL